MSLVYNSEFALKQNENDDFGSNGNAALKIAHDIFDPIDNNLVNDFLERDPARTMDIANKLLMYANSIPDNDNNATDIENIRKYITHNDTKDVWLEHLDAWALEQQQKANAENNAGQINAGGGTPDVVNTGGGTPDVVNAGGGTPDVVNAGGGTPDVVNTGGGTPDVVNAGGSTPDVVNAGGGTPDVVNDNHYNENSPFFQDAMYYLDGIFSENEIRAQFNENAQQAENFVTLIERFQSDHFSLIHGDNRRSMHEWIIDQSERGENWVQAIQNWNREHYDPNGAPAIRTNSGYVSPQSLLSQFNQTYATLAEQLGPNVVIDDHIDYNNPENLKYRALSGINFVDLVGEHRLMGRMTDYWRSTLADYQEKSQNGRASTQELLDIPVIQNIIQYNVEGRARIADLAAGLSSGRGYVLQLAPDDFQLKHTSTRTVVSMCTEFGERWDPKTMAIYYAGTNASAERITEINNYIRANPMTWYYDFYQMAGGGGITASGGNQGGGGEPDWGDALGGGNPFDGPNSIQLQYGLGRDTFTTRQEDHDQRNSGNNPTGTGLLDPVNDADPLSGLDAAFRDANGIDSNNSNNDRRYFADGTSSETFSIRDNQGQTVYSLTYNTDGTIADSTSTYVYNDPYGWLTPLLTDTERISFLEANENRSVTIDTRSRTYEDGVLNDGNGGFFLFSPNDIRQVDSQGNPLPARGVTINGVETLVTPKTNFVATRNVHTGAIDIYAEGAGFIFRGHDVDGKVVGQIEVESLGSSSGRYQTWVFPAEVLPDGRILATVPPANENTEDSNGNLMGNGLNATGTLNPPLQNDSRPNSILSVQNLLVQNNQRTDVVIKYTGANGEPQWIENPNPQTQLPANYSLEITNSNQSVERYQVSEGRILSKEVITTNGNSEHIILTVYDADGGIASVTERDQSLRNGAGDVNLISGGSEGAPSTGNTNLLLNGTRYENVPTSIVTSLGSLQVASGGIAQRAANILEAKIDDSTAITPFMLGYVANLVRNNREDLIENFLTNGTIFASLNPPIFKTEAVSLDPRYRAAQPGETGLIEAFDPNSGECYYVVLVNTDVAHSADGIDASVYDLMNGTPLAVVDTFADPTDNRSPVDTSQLLPETNVFLATLPLAVKADMLSRIPPSVLNAMQTGAHATANALSVLVDEAVSTRNVSKARELWAVTQHLFAKGYLTNFDMKGASSVLSRVPGVVGNGGFIHPALLAVMGAASAGYIAGTLLYQNSELVRSGMDVILRNIFGDVDARVESWLQQNPGAREGT